MDRPSTSRKKSNRNSNYLQKTANNSIKGRQTGRNTSSMSYNEAQFKTIVEHDGSQRFHNLKTGGWVNVHLKVGQLTRKTNENRRFLFEFKLDHVVLDAWSAKSNPMCQNIWEKLIEGKEYILKGTLLAEKWDKKYFSVSNSKFPFSLRISEIKDAQEYSSLTIETRRTIKEVNQLIASNQSFTADVQEVEILSGQVWRYMGCPDCFTSLPKPDKNGKFYCKICTRTHKTKRQKLRRVCIIIRDLALKDKSNARLHKNAVCFHEQCEQLFGPDLFNLLCKVQSDLAVREIFEKFVGKKMMTTICGKLSTKRGFKNELEVSLKDINVLESTSSSIYQEITSAQRNCKDSSAQCSCSIDQNDTDEGEGEQHVDPIEDFESPTTCPEILKLPDLPNSSDIYQLKRNPQGWIGLVMIVNMTVNRPGTSVDVKRLHNLFPSIGFQIFRGKAILDPTRSGFISALDKYKRELLKGQYSSSIVVFMGHGSMYTLEFKKQRLGIYQDILNHFGEIEFSEFTGKPKIFIFQSCQNYPELKGIDLKLDYKALWDVNDTQIIADTLECYPCLPGVKAKRNIKTGSYFIQTFANVLEQDWRDKDLVNIMNKVQQEMRRERFEDSSVNIPVYKPILFHAFHFGASRSGDGTEPME